MNIRTLLKVASAVCFIALSPLVQAQNSGTVTSHAFAVGKGPGVTGYTSLLCTSAQLAVGQAAADPICQTLTGDVTISAGGVTTIGATKVTSAMLNADVFSTAHSWGGQQTFVAPVLGTPASGTLTNATGLPISTGVSGLGTGVATFLATPSSANLRAALTDEVGTGAAYFVGGALGTPASATLTNATGLPLTGLAPQVTNTIVANATAGSASPTAISIPSCSTASSALTWTTSTGFGCNTVAGGGASPTTNVQTVDYTIQTSDCWKEVQVGTGATGKKTITLPATAGFTAGCMVFITNGDISTRSGKLLSGFPAGCISTKYMLFPGVTVALAVVNSNWVYASCPGQYVPTAAMTLTVDATGSDSTGDGFTAPFATLQRCISIFEQAVFTPSDITQPTCQFTSNIVESATHFYPALGTNTLNIAGSSCAFTWKPSGANQYALYAGNGGNVQLSCMNLSGTGTTCLAALNCTLVLGHNNNVVIETLSSVTCTDAGSNGICLSNDVGTAGGVEWNIDNGLTVAGTIGNVLAVNGRSSIMWNGVITASGTPTINQIFQLTGISTACLQSTFNSSGTFGTARQFAVLNGSQLFNLSANAIPGSNAGITTAAGFNGGAVVATSAVKC